jgi:ring-1,2-phenylacetyl-CoA epoxidase subunit PaaD
VVRTEADTVERRVREALDLVHDPEIPACSITDLGMVDRVEVTEGTVEIDLLPTFVGCPAKDLIGDDVRAALRDMGGDREVTDRGRARLREFGIAPHWDRPAGGPVTIPLMTAATVPCPYCGSADTVMESRWGPTPCRAQHWCRSCRNPFEGFKEKSPV